MRIDFHPGATEDLESSSDWYAQRSSTAARNFLVAVELWLVYIASDYADDLQDCIDASEEYHVATNVRGPNALAEFWTRISHIGMLGYQTTLLT